ncbi:MAG: hypothetical protein FWE53_01740 [Firmicutes bacterium]|nr:hypothetical protein [Bacillota bacterium]
MVLKKAWKIVIGIVAGLCITIASFFVVAYELYSWDNETQIRRTYYCEHLTWGIFKGIWLKDAYIQKNYGTYNDCIVVMMNAKGIVYIAATGEEDVAGIVFGYAYAPQTILVFKNRKLYSLTTAYNNGCLTFENLQEIHDIHNNL